ncbi:MAG TPA: hypothetical protein VHN74_19285 [Candidatus Angelobacter sp.]|nr:hypothetical protein [Candidatus Angelobacter sp.]
MKRIIWLLVLYGIVHVLLCTPPPEIGVAFAGKYHLSLMPALALALLESAFLTILLFFAPLVWRGSSISLLDKICLRLC